MAEIAEGNGWITQIGWQDTLPDVQLPVSGGGSSSTYYCDTMIEGKSSVVSFGFSASGLAAGLFSWNTQGFVDWNYSARLSHWALIEK